jgi:hypothetical protein
MDNPGTQATLGTQHTGRGQKKTYNTENQKDEQHRSHKIKEGVEEFEDTKGVTRIRISKKNRKHNGQKNKGPKENQRSTKHTHKTKDRVT